METKRQVQFLEKAYELSRNADFVLRDVGKELGLSDDETRDVANALAKKGLLEVHRITAVFSFGKNPPALPPAGPMKACLTAEGREQVLYLREREREAEQATAQARRDKWKQRGINFAVAVLAYVAGVLSPIFTDAIKASIGGNQGTPSTMPAQP